MRRLAAAAAAALLVSMVLVPVAALAKPPDSVGPVEVSTAVRMAVSPLMREVASLPTVPPPVGSKKDDRPLRHLGGQGTSGPNAAIQSAPGPALAATPGAGFPGVGTGDYGFVDQWAPPDTNGSVGATQYVQWVNTAFAVFDKVTGTLVLGPTTGNTLFAKLGGPCAADNDGDPIVVYDKLANRWVFTQFAVAGGPPYYQCVAVSQTSDATGAYNLYAFSEPNFNDYPKLAVWPDAYYASFNMFSGTGFAGARACAFDRNAMLRGLTAKQVCFQLSFFYGGLLPSDLDGSTPPPQGSPDFFLNFGSNSLNLWKFHVNFATPASSTFSGPTGLAVAAFSPACGGGTCIPQPGTTQQLDSLGDRLMYRLAYRNFGDHEALVVNHSVTAGASVGVRWYELRNPAGSTLASGTPVVYQQGTFAPDASYRWMGSIAQDRSGDMALGYSLSSASVFPSVAYTGRVPGDAAGTMEQETVAKNGSGSQNTNSLSRWGDYSSMSVDPVDDCTFWYTNEYLKANGSWNWSTWITSFRFPGCQGTVSQAPTITSPKATTFTIGTPGSFTVTATGSPTPSISESGALPGNVTFIDNHNGTATLSGTPAVGSDPNYPITFSATNGVSPDASQGFTLTVNAATQAPVITSPNSATFTVGSAGSLTVTTTGSPTPVVTETGALPGGVTFIGNANGTATLVGTPASGTSGNYPITFSATNSAGSNAQAFTLTVNASIPALVVTTTSLPSDRQRSTYPPTTLQAANGALPYSWLVVSGALPPNLLLSSGGTISGMPTKVGTFSFTVQVKDTSGNAATATLSIKISQH
jgi:hypothetical protein